MTVKSGVHLFIIVTQAGKLRSQIVTYLLSLTYDEIPNLARIDAAKRTKIV
jgi:hypothetical protein